MVNIADVVAAGKEFGIFDFYLPFIIMFALFFGILNKINVFGTDKSGKRINVILAGAMSLFVMIYTPTGVVFSEFLSGFFGKTLVAIISILAVIMVVFILFPAFGYKPGEWGKDKKLGRGVTLVVALIALIAIALFISSNGLAFFPGLTFGQLPGVSTPSILLPAIPGLSSQDLGIVFLVVATIAVMIWLMRGEKGGTGNTTTQPGRTT